MADLKPHGFETDKKLQDDGGIRFCMKKTTTMGNIKSLQKDCSCYFFEGDLGFGVSCFMYISLRFHSFPGWGYVSMILGILLLMVWMLFFSEQLPVKGKTPWPAKPKIIHVPTIQERPGSFFLKCILQGGTKKPLLKGFTA